MLGVANKKYNNLLLIILEIAKKVRPQWQSPSVPKFLVK